MDSMHLITHQSLLRIPMKLNLHSAIDLGQITVGYHLRRLVADTDLESRRAPVDKLDGSLSLQCRDRTMNVLGNDIATVEQARRHVLSISRIAFDHLVVGLEARHRNLLNRVCLMGSFGSGDDRGVGDQWEVDAWVWHQIGLEFGKIDVERTIESKRGSDGRND